ncbi:DNA-methyltransferase [Xaviernesmea oryzae]|nr:site-specific DNA-methyltransferase [Xaviernesmea oryzae]
MQEIPDSSVDLVLTDPPYGTTACKWDAVIPSDEMWLQVKRVLKQNGAAVFTASQPFTSALVMSNPRQFKYEWIWEKSKATGFFKRKVAAASGAREHIGLLTGTDAIFSQHGSRCCLQQRFAQVEVRSDGERYPRSVQKFRTAEREGGFHKTQKPIALMEYLIRIYTNEGETVLDFTMGSGTTGVACANTGRRFIGIERDENYFQIAKDRIAAAQPATIAPVPDNDNIQSPFERLIRSILAA